MPTAISAIPRIVCETIHSLELHDETPSWKIMDNKGRVTVVLHWDQRHHQDKQPAKGNDARSPNKRLVGERPSLVIQTSLDKLGTFIRSPCILKVLTFCSHTKRTNARAVTDHLCFFFHIFCPSIAFTFITLLSFEFFINF